MTFEDISPDAMTVLRKEFQRLTTTEAATNPSLNLFWTDVVGGKVIEVDREIGNVVGDLPTVKTLAFDGYLDASHECAKWGPSFSFSVLVEREEYNRCWKMICSHNWQFILLRGTKGIGKSVFIFWLIYKIVAEARAQDNDIPTFMLISSGRAGSCVYDYLCEENGIPAVKRITSELPKADYVLSDVEFDASAVTSKWNLNVVSYGAVREPDGFLSKVGDAKTVNYCVFYYLRCLCVYFALMLFSFGAL